MGRRYANISSVFRGYIQSKHRVIKPQYREEVSGKRLVIPAKRTRLCPSVRLQVIGVLLLLIASCAWIQPGTLDASPLPQEDGSGPVAVEASPQIFATMCALAAAGFAGKPVPSDPELAQMQAHLRSLHGPATEALRDFYHGHSLSDSGATLSRFMTFALTAGPPPKFEPVLKPDALPPDVVALRGFADVLANFYAEADIESLWHQFEPAYDRDSAKIREPLTQIVLTSTAYLREIIHPGVRTFRVYVEPMVGGETNVRNIGDRYAVVINPASPPLDLIRHAFLHFLLDPLPIRYRDKLVAEQPLLFLADRAPNLPYAYRTDLTSFFTECLIRAVELRVQRLPPAQLAAEATGAEADGYVLIPPLLKGLAKFETAEPSIEFYFPDLVQSIDVVAEQQRLQKVKFAPASTTEQAQERAEGPDTKKGDAAASALEAELSSAERLIAEQDASGAAQAFERILLKSPGQPRALYGLAVASVLQGDAEHARSLFQGVIDAANATSLEMRPDPSALAWSHVYLGRMHDLEDDRDLALQEYRAALTIGNAPEAARSAAQHGIQQAYRPAASKPSPE